MLWFPIFGFEIFCKENEEIFEIFHLTIHKAGLCINLVVKSERTSEKEDKETKTSCWLGWSKVELMVSQVGESWAEKGESFLNFGHEWKNHEGKSVNGGVTAKVGGWG